MSAAPDVCAACGTPMPSGELRCRQCGKVYGDDNYCAGCHDTVAVRRAPDGYRCLACNALRERKPGTIVSGGEPIAPRAATGLLRGLGALSIAGGVFVSAAVFALFDGDAGAAFAAASLVGGAGAGALFLRGGARSAAAVERRRRAQRELAIFELAERKGGTLTVTEVARAFGLSTAEAQATLESMADGSRVTVDVTSEGLLEYVFRELAASRGPSVRVAVEPPEETSRALEAPRDDRREIRR